jgi:hypothetical protein
MGEGVRRRAAHGVPAEPFPRPEVCEIEVRR